MLAVSSYKPDYIATCLKAVEAQLKVFRALPKGKERDAFEPQFFRHMVLALDHYFIHRQRSKSAPLRRHAGTAPRALRSDLFHWSCTQSTAHRVKTARTAR